MLVTALTTFYHTDGGMWLQGETRELSNHRADELRKVGLVSPVLVTEPAKVEPQSKPKKRSTKPFNPVKEIKPENPVKETK